MDGHERSLERGDSVVVRIDFDRDLTAPAPATPPSERACRFPRLTVSLPVGDDNSTCERLQDQAGEPDESSRTPDANEPAEAEPHASTPAGMPAFTSGVAVDLGALAGVSSHPMSQHDLLSAAAAFLHHLRTPSATTVTSPTAGAAAALSPRTGLAIAILPTAFSAFKRSRRRLSAGYESVPTTKPPSEDGDHLDATSTEQTPRPGQSAQPSVTEWTTAADGGAGTVSEPGDATAASAVGTPRLGGTLWSRLPPGTPLLDSPARHDGLSVAPSPTLGTAGPTPRALRRALTFAERAAGSGDLRVPLLQAAADDLLLADETLAAAAVAAGGIETGALVAEMGGYAPPKGLAALRRAVLPPPVSLARILALTVSMGGIEFIWAVQITFTVPIFLLLGLSPFYSSIVWLAGPLSGLIIQPLVGALSDQCTWPLGRRRPFILAGLVATLAGCVCLSNAADLARVMGVPGKGFAITIAAGGTALLVSAVNAMAGPCRALAHDLTPPEQSVLVAAGFTFMAGFGQLFGYFVAHLDLKTLVPLLAMGSHVRALFTIGSIALTTTVLATVAAAQEMRFETPRGHVKAFWASLCAAAGRTAGALASMSPKMQRLAVVQFFSWMSMFLFLIYNSSWLAQDIYGGVAGAEGIAGERYEAGVRTAALAMCLHSITSMVAAPLLPKAIDLAGIRAVFLLSHAYFGSLLLLARWATTPVQAAALVAACGSHFAVIVTVPYALCAEFNASAGGSHDDAGAGGLQIGVLNVYIVLPQFVVALGGGLLLHAVSYSIGTLLAIAGGVALVAAILILQLL